MKYQITAELVADESKIAYALEGIREIYYRNTRFCAFSAWSEFFASHLCPTGYVNLRKTEPVQKLSKSVSKAKFCNYLTRPHLMASSEYVVGRPFFLDLSVDYQLSMTSLLNQKVMLPLFIKDRLYSLQLRIRYLSFFLERFLSFLEALLCLCFCVLTKNL